MGFALSKLFGDSFAYVERPCRRSFRCGVACRLLPRAVRLCAVRLEKDAVEELPAPAATALDVLTSKFAVDGAGFVIVGVDNTGPTIKDARINVLVPLRQPRQWVARITKAGKPASENGTTDRIHHELVPGVPKSARWIETNLEIHGYSTTQWKFFAARVEGDPFEIMIGADEFHGFSSWTFTMPPGPEGHRTENKSS